MKQRKAAKRRRVQSTHLCEWQGAELLRLRQRQDDMDKAILKRSIS